MNVWERLVPAGVILRVYAKQNDVREFPVTITDNRNTHCGGNCYCRFTSHGSRKNSPIVRTILISPRSDYAKNHIPINALVSEHQPTSWSSYYLDMQMLTVMFPVGLYYLLKQPTFEGIFIMTYGPTSLYLSGVMVHLILVLALVMCISGSVEVSSTFKSFVLNLDPGEHATT
ncbi:uncharacterized protein DEA37_0006974 [Paragonimus westermani]|uniref:Dolichyl-diphosphooligosaccharide--protein glycosyltransferase subunit STT3A n=1 Tax=Paragonimus westermani TaxID=34504 RepID=A0A5J4NYF6_9TREM|nr:uncharacterized protein DEA37_0006974 [Paragonimus westermani]